MTRVGFVGLGQMGSALAANLATAGHDLFTHDVAGPPGNPTGGTFCTSVAEVAAHAEVVVLSLPDGTASMRVAAEVVAAAPSQVQHLVNTSTVGLRAAEAVAATLDQAGVGFVDAAVSGGPAGARARTLMVMYAGPQPTCDAVAPVLAGLSDQRHRIGDRAGMAQAAKLANNFLSATALAATSEAITFAEAAGVDMATMLDVLNASSGQSAATSDKFVNQVLTGRYESGFANSLMAKDLQLYLTEATARGVPTSLGEMTTGLWCRFADEEPSVDFTRIYPFVRSAARAHLGS